MQRMNVSLQFSQKLQIVLHGIFTSENIKNGNPNVKTIKITKLFSSKNNLHHDSKGSFTEIN